MSGDGMFQAPASGRDRLPMIIWHSPQALFWIAAKCFRQSPNPESVLSAMTAILDFATRSDRVGMRARDLLANIRFGAAGDAEEMAPRIYIGRSGEAPALATSEYRGHRRLAEIENRSAEAEGRVLRQAALVQRLSLGDRDATLAVAFLQTMQTTLRLMHQHKSVLLRDLARSRASKYSSGSAHFSAFR